MIAEEEESEVGFVGTVGVASDRCEPVSCVKPAVSSNGWSFTQEAPVNDESPPDNGRE